MKAVYRKELLSYFTGVTGWLFIAFLVITVSIFSSMLNFVEGYRNYEYAIGRASFVFLIIIPILTMRSFSEERHQRTDRLLYSLPLKLSFIVIGKYLAMLTILLISCLILSVVPLIFTLYGSVLLSTAYSSILAFFLLGATLIAIGMFISSITENQVAAAIISFSVFFVGYLSTAIISYLSFSVMASFAAIVILALIICVLLWVITKQWLLSGGFFLITVIALVLILLINSSVFEGAFQNVLSWITPFGHFQNFIDGLFDINAVVYYITTTILFVFFTVQSIEKRRWN